MNELLQLIPQLRHVSGTEYEGPCPLCEGGKDRFCLWTDGGLDDTGRYYCRRCEKSGNAVELVMAVHGMSEAAARVAVRLDGPDDWKRRPWSLGVEVGSWTYTSEAGKPVYQSVRYEPPPDHPSHGQDKTFLPYRFGVRKAGLGKVPRIPYRLPELKQAAEEGRVVVLVEGERHADELAQSGFVATTTVSGSGSWRDDYADHFKGAALVAILRDHDEPGLKYAHAAARSLMQRDVPVRIIDLHEGEPERGQDVLDWMAQDVAVDELREIIRAAPEADPVPDEPDRKPVSVSGSQYEPAGDGEEESKPTQASILIEMASAWKLYHTPEGDEYARIPAGSHTEVHRIRSKGARDHLRRSFYESEGKPPGSQAMQDAVEHLSAMASFEGKESEVHVRVAAHDGAVYVDLCNAAHEVVEITPEGWKIVTNPPVLFRRAKGMLELPRPVDGSMDLLRPHLELSDEDHALVCAWLTSVFWERGPYPILALKGEHGSGKSTKSRMIRALVDPSTVPLRSQARTEQDLVIAATNGRVVAYDNSSGVPVWLSDALCRISTGGGFGTRQLYSDGEEKLFSATRPILLNGIDDLLERPDLADRAIEITLPSIDPETRKTEREVMKAFERDRPGIIGAICEAVATALRRGPTFTLREVPRMADFAVMAASAEPAFGVPEGTFLRAYEGNRAAAVELAAENDIVVSAIRTLLEASGSFEGTTSDLRDKLMTYLPDPEKPPKDFPANTQAMTAHLRRVAPVLRGIGIAREDLPREGKSRRRTFRIEWVRKSTSATSVTSASAKSGQNRTNPADKVADKLEGGTSATSAARPPKNGVFDTVEAESGQADKADKPLHTHSTRPPDEVEYIDVPF